MLDIGMRLAQISYHVFEKSFEGHIPIPLADNVSDTAT